MLFLRFGIVPIEGFGGLLRLFCEGDATHQIREWALVGGFSLHPAAVVGVGMGCDKQIWGVRSD